MHEISIAESILEIAEKKAREQNARSILLIKVRLGEFTTIVREALEFAFEIGRKGTLSEQALLEIETVPMVLHCAVCSSVTEPVKGVCLICSQCGFPLEVVSGEELNIEYIEIETEEEWSRWNQSQSRLQKETLSAFQSRPMY